MEAAQARVQKAVTDHTEDFERNVVRAIERETYLCHAKCCENMRYGMDDKNRCIERCSQRLMKLQEFVQNEMSAFQNRLQRCAMDCQDRARDSLTGASSTLEQEKAQSQLESCVIKCADTHIDLMVPLFKRLKDGVAKEKYS